MKLKMDMNHRTLTVWLANGVIENYEYSDDLPINSMVNYLIKTELKISNHKKELELLEVLQVLTI